MARNYREIDGGVTENVKREKNVNEAVVQINIFPEGTNRGMVERDRVNGSILIRNSSRPLEGEKNCQCAAVFLSRSAKFCKPTECPWVADAVIPLFTFLFSCHCRRVTWEQTSSDVESTSGRCCTEQRLSTCTAEGSDFIWLDINPAHSGSASYLRLLRLPDCKQSPLRERETN